MLMGPRTAALDGTFTLDPGARRRHLAAAVRGQMHWYQRLAAGCRRRAQAERDPDMRAAYVRWARRDLQHARGERDLLHTLDWRLP